MKYLFPLSNITILRPLYIGHLTQPLYIPSPIIPPPPPTVPPTQGTHHTHISRAQLYLPQFQNPFDPVYCVLGTGYWVLCTGYDNHQSANTKSHFSSANKQQMLGHSELINLVIKLIPHPKYSSLLTLSLSTLIRK